MILKGHEEYPSAIRQRGQDKETKEVKCKVCISLNYTTILVFPTLDCQEISLARKATVHCGRKVIGWHQLVDAVALLVAQQDNIRKLVNSSKWRYGHRTIGETRFSSVNLLLHVISNMFMANEDGLNKKPLKSIEYLATTLQMFHASQSHDTIYDLLGLAKDVPQMRSEKQGKPI